MRNKKHARLEVRDGVKGCTYLPVFELKLESGYSTCGPRRSGRLDRRNCVARAWEMTGFIVDGGVGDDPKSGQSAKLQPSLQG